MYAERPWFYSVDGHTFAAHVRSCAYRDLVRLHDELESAVAGCAKHDSTGRALAVNERRMGVVVVELARRAGEALAADTRDRARR